MNSIVQRIVRFLEVDIWRVQPEELSPVRRIACSLVKKLYLAIRFFTAKRVVTQAAALTYSTLLAIVPILAVVFAIARGFGYNRYIEVWFRGALESQPQVAEVIIGFVNSYLVHTKSGIFLGIGLVFMLYTVLMLVSNIEQTFNTIWQVKKARSIFRTFTDYLAMFFIFPILIVLTSGLTLFLATIAGRAPDFLLLGPMMRLMIDLLPYVLMSAMFIALYTFMPNTHVRLGSTIVPGILAGIAMQWLQFFYIHSQMWVSGYNAIYGSFAALPLFMLWLQISWTICLFGAELSYTNQYLSYYDYDASTGDISHRYRLMLCTLLMSRICHRYAQGGKPYTAASLRDETNIPIRVVTDLLYQLIDARMLIEITTDEKGETARYVPAEDINRLSVGTMQDRLEAAGHWKLDIPLARLFKPEWVKSAACRSDYLNRQRAVLLKDLAAD